MKYLKERRLKIIDGAIIIVPYSAPYKNMASEPECKMSAVIQVLVEHFDMETIYYKRSLFRCVASITISCRISPIVLQTG